LIHLDIPFRESKKPKVGAIRHVDFSKIRRILKTDPSLVTVGIADNSFHPLSEFSLDLAAIIVASISV
jgi:hypothetical protein